MLFQDDINNDEAGLPDISRIDNTNIRDYATSNNLVNWACSGTVASAALEFAIHFKAQKIYLVGLDLAYPTDMSHASDTMDCQKKIPNICR